MSWDEDYSGPLLRTEAEVRIVAEFMTDLPDLLEAIQTGYVAAHPATPRLDYGPSVDDQAFHPRPEGGGFAFMSRSANRYRDYECAGTLLPSMYEVLHEIEAKLSERGEVQYRDHDASFDKLHGAVLTLGALAAIGNKYAPVYVVRALLAALGIIDASQRLQDRAYLQWKSAAPWVYRGAHRAYRYMHMDAAYDIR